MGCSNSKEDPTRGGGTTPGSGHHKSGVEQKDFNNHHAEAPPKFQQQKRTSMILTGVEDRIDSCHFTMNATLGAAKVRYAYLSQRGYYPDDENKANQDAYDIKENFCSSSMTDAEDNNDAFLAVFDGHGRYGDSCAQFAKEHLGKTIEKAVAEACKKKGASMTQNGSIRNLQGTYQHDSNISLLTKEEFQQVCHAAHLQCNKMMHQAKGFDDSLSGTTSISAAFHGGGGGEPEITVCNVGDSRAIVGQQAEGSSSFRALPLSVDQTPYRRDERRRIKKTGARILSLDQIEGLEPIEESDGEGEDLQLGETIDEGGDPPRVWAPNGEYPGTAFTRSLGDMIAEELGVVAEPEMVTRPIRPEDKIIVLASDGVFEFLTNQSVIDICAKFDDPLEACRAVVAESYELWLQYELRTDDITMICIFVDDLLEPKAMTQWTDSKMDGVEGNGRSSIGSVQSATSDGDALPSQVQKPVRTEMSTKKKMELQKRKGKSTRIVNYDDDFDITDIITEKTEDDKARIAEAIKASVIFKDINEKQREMIYGVMEQVSVKAGDWVIKQGEMGDKFYIVEQGKFEVRIVPQGGEDVDGSGGTLVHVYAGSRASNAHPSFGELALMYSAPRAASIIAQTDGHLWALHRAVFNKILAEHNVRREIRHKLRKLRAFRGLTTEELQTLVDSMEEVMYEKGETIVSEGDEGDCFFFIISGSCEQTSEGEAPKAMKESDYFGESMLLKKGTFSSTVKALQETKCLKLSVSIIEGKVGSLVGRNTNA